MRRNRAFTLIELPFDKLRVVRQREREAFTLIELLVVVAIICVIIAILAPILTVAKEMARRAVCAANLHNNHVAFMIYATDNKGLLPHMGDHPYCDYWISLQDANNWVKKYFGGNIGTMYCPSIILALRNTYTPDSSPQWWWNNWVSSGYHGILYDIHTNPGVLSTLYGEATPAIKSPGFYLKTMEDDPRMALCNDLNSPNPTWNGSWAVAHRNRKDLTKPAEGGNVGTLRGDVKWKRYSTIIGNSGGVFKPPNPDFLTQQYFAWFWYEYW